MNRNESKCAWCKTEAQAVELAEEQCRRWGGTYYIARITDRVDRGDVPVRWSKVSNFEEKDKMTENIPQDYTEQPEPVMGNFDYKIDAAVRDKKVWRDGEQFKHRMKRYLYYIAAIFAPILEDFTESMTTKYGWD